LKYPKAAHQMGSLIGDRECQNPWKKGVMTGNTYTLWQYLILRRKQQLDSMPLSDIPIDGWNFEP
jgi:hypothetical protein